MGKIWSTNTKIKCTHSNPHCPAESYSLVAGDRDCEPGTRARRMLGRGSRWAVRGFSQPGSALTAYSRDGRGSETDAQALGLGPRHPRVCNTCKRALTKTNTLLPTLLLSSIVLQLKHFAHCYTLFLVPKRTGLKTPRELSISVQPHWMGCS